MKHDESIKPINELLASNDFWNRHSKRYVTKEFQDYGYRLSLKLNDPKHTSLYIKLAKDEKRVYLEEALRFAVDYPKAKNKGRIFMWKLKQIKAEKDKK